MPWKDNDFSGFEKSNTNKKSNLKKELTDRKIDEALAALWDKIKATIMFWRS